MKKNFSSLDLFEGGAEARNKSVGKVADEADGIGKQDLAAGRKLQLPELGVKGSEHARRFEHAGLGEGIEEGALAGVGVADERDHRDRDCLATLTLLMADAADGVELGLDMVEAKVDFAAIGLELRFARAAGSDAATKLRHGATASGEARQLVFELREFYLELAFTGLGVAGEDVEDELRTVDYVARQPGFDVAELRRSEVVIEENKRSVGRSDGLNNFVEFALADEAVRVGLLPTLDESGGNGRPGRSGEFLELCAAGIEVEGGGCMVREAFFSSHDGSCGAGKSSGCRKLLVLAEFAGELNHYNHGKFLLSLRGAEFAGEECRVLGLTCFDEAATDRLSAIPA
jgi:hypothetical protein